MTVILHRTSLRCWLGAAAWQLTPAAGCTAFITIAVSCLEGPVGQALGWAFHLPHRTSLGQRFTLGLSGLGGSRLKGSSVMVRAPDWVLPVLSTSAKGASVITPT